MSRHLNLCDVLLKSVPSQDAATVSSLMQVSCPPCNDGKARTTSVVFKCSHSAMRSHNIFTYLLKSSFNSV